MAELVEVLPKGEERYSPWFWWQWIDEEFRNLDKLVPRLHRECEGSDKSVALAYFVNKFASIAKIAIPIVDKYEGS